MNLSDLITEEPPYVLRPDEAVRAGRRRKARRLALLGAGTAGAVAGVVGLAALVLPSGGSPAVTLQPAASGDPTAAPDRWTSVIRAHTPAAWSINGIEVSDSGWSADVDDGRGAGRLYAGFSPHPGSLQQHPCQDSEFVQGGKCEETELGDGRRLIVREVQPVGEFRSVVAVVVHRDGGGVDVGNDNATFPRIAPGTTFTSGEDKLAKTRGTVTRTMPLLDAQSLAEIALALDEAAS